jgi:hypothetical protein
MEAILTSSHGNGSDMTNGQSDEITRKAGNETRQARTHTCAPDTSSKLKSLQDSSIRVNPKVTKEDCVSICTCAKSSIRCSSHPIPSTARSA